MVIRIRFDSPQQRPPRRRYRGGFAKFYLEGSGTLWWIDTDRKNMKRNTVAQQISRLRKKGWQIESIPGKGYKVISRPLTPLHSTQPAQPIRAEPRPTISAREILLAHGHLWWDELPDVAEGREPVERDTQTMTRGAIARQIYYLRHRKKWTIETTPRGYLLRERPPDGPRARGYPGFVKAELLRHKQLVWRDVEKLPIGRTSVRKQVYYLRKKGWDIETTARGFRLRGSPKRAPRARSHPGLVKRHLLRHNQLTGQEAAQLPISKESICSQIVRLRKKGWLIETSHNGYRLLAVPPSEVQHNGQAEDNSTGPAATN